MANPDSIPFRDVIETLRLGLMIADKSHRIIYDELCVGVIRDDSRETYRAIMANLVARGAQGIILGCTEIGLLVGASDTTVPVFDTTRIHAEAAVDWALADVHTS